MKTEATSVDEYLKLAPEDRREVLTKLRAIHRKAYKGVEEMIDYGMPCYKRDGQMVAAFASLTQCVAVYGLATVMAKYKAELKGASLGKGCVRFKNAAAVNLKLVETMVREAAAAKSAKG